MAASSSLTAAAWRRRWPAPAKLNLFLHVLDQRADSYHLLQTVFRLIELVDWLEFAPRKDSAIRLTQPLPDVPEENDLTVRAAKLLCAAAGLRAKATITVEKRIPIGGGLDGGSSDAATTLITLNRLWGAGLSRAELSALAAHLGADIPFFLFGQNAFAEGIGERLTPLAPEPSWYVVITPQLAVSTREIFDSAQLTRDTKPLTITDFFAGRRRHDLQPGAVRQ